MKRVDIIYFEASSGHKSAAESLRAALSVLHPDWSVRTVDLRDILRCQTRLLDFIYTNGVRFFNWSMQRERYFFFATCIHLWIIFARLCTTFQPLHFLLRWTSRFWADGAPDAIVSVTPMKHTIVYESARIVNPLVKCITIPTDYREMLPGYWFQAGVRQLYLLGSPQLMDQALRSGVPPKELRELGGMVISPRFYDATQVDKDTLLASLGLDPALPTGVISFGGQGTINVLRCARRIAEVGLRVNMICLCGQNEPLLKSVQILKTPYPLVALGTTSRPALSPGRIADYMKIADFMVGKPGTMTLTEALISRTPFIFIKSTGLSIVHGPNEDWVLQNGVGVMAESPESVDSAITQVFNDPEMLPRIDACFHRGVFDAVDEITAALTRSQCAATFSASVPESV